jgi:drug/metabolite transporter (DMT)-like permease
MIKRDVELRAYAMLGLVMVFWAGNSIVGRAVRNDIPPFTLAFVRWTGALILMSPFAVPKALADRGMIARHWRILLLLGLVGVAAFNGFLYLGLRFTTATNGLLLQALIPALVLVFGLALFRERASWGQVLGVTLSTLGVGVIVFQADPTAILKLRFGLGDGLVMCGVVAWALYTSLLRLRPAIQPLSFLFVTFAVGALAMAPLAASEWRQVMAIHWRPEVFAAFAYVAVLPSVTAYFLYNAAVAMIGAAAAGQTISLMPVFGAGLAALLLNEPLRPYHLIGMALICGGIAVTALMMRRAPARGS